LKRLFEGCVRGQEGVHQGLHLGGHAVSGQGLADGAALGGEVLRIGQRDGGGDGLGVGCCGGEVAVEGVGVVVLGDWQGPDEIVEVTGIYFIKKLKTEKFLSEHGNHLRMLGTTGSAAYKRVHVRLARTHTSRHRA